MDEEIEPRTTIIVSAPRASDFRHYLSLTVSFKQDRNEETQDFLLSQDQKTLILLTKIDLHDDPFVEVMKKIHVNGRPIRGNPQSRVTVVVYDDFQCPFCAHAYQLLFPELLKEYGEHITIVFKDFPLVKIHPWATHAAIDANCLALQSADAYWDFADYIHNNQMLVTSHEDLEEEFGLLDALAMAEISKFKIDRVQLASCIEKQDDNAVRESIKEGESLEIAGTPTIFVNGERLAGVASPSEFRAAIQNALRDAGVVDQSYSSWHPAVSLPQ